MHHNQDGVVYRNENGKRVEVGWSAFGELITENRQQRVSLQQTFDIPGVYTVGFSIEYPGSGPQAYVEAEATIDWMVKGNAVTRKMTVSDGASITGTGEGIRVVIRDVTTVIAVPGQHLYKVTVTIAKGARQHMSAPPTLTSGVAVAVAPAGNFTFTVPPDAGIKSAMVIVGNDVAVTGPILDQEAIAEHRDPSGSHLIKRYDPRMFPWVPVDGNTGQIIVSNRRAAGDMRFAVVYGIDG